MFGVLFGGTRPWDSVVSGVILVLVLSNVALLVLGSVDSVATPNATLFFVLEAVSVGLFTLEYLLRLYCCVEKRKLNRLGPVLGRLVSSLSSGRVFVSFFFAALHGVVCCSR